MKKSLMMIAVAATLVAVGQAAAQTVPYQYGSRGDIGTGLGQTSLPKGRVFQPRIEAAVQYAENLELADDGEPQVNTAGLELSPGFYAAYSSDYVVAVMDYSLVGRGWEDSDFNDVTQRLAANGEWFAVPEWFSIRGQAGYDDVVIDPANGLNYAGLGIFGGSNLTEAASASINPTLSHRFNDFEFIAQYEYGRTWYLDVGKGNPSVSSVGVQDSEDQDARVSFGTAETEWRISAVVYYDWQRSDYESALPYEYERVGLDAGVQISRTLTIVGGVGKESDLELNTTDGGLDKDFWDAGLRYVPNDRTSAEVRYGERFFGDSYLFSLDHRARLLHIIASYSEQPTVESRSIGMGDFNPGELPPGLPGAQVGRLTASPYVAKDARVSVLAEGTRTGLSLSVYQSERNFLRGLETDETNTGIEFGASRDLASNLSADLSLSYGDYEWGGTTVGPIVSDPSDAYDTQATFRLNRESGERLTLSGEAGYLSRSGDENYDGWWVALRAKYEP